MDKETANYVVNYFPEFLTGSEKLAIRHWQSMIKLDLKEISNQTVHPSLSIYKKHGWISEDIEIINLLKDGYDDFELKIAERIVNENGKKIFFNNCPKCNKLARTPQAKQCKFCTFNWRPTNV